MKPVARIEPTEDRQYILRVFATDNFVGYTKRFSSFLDARHELSTVSRELRSEYRTANRLSKMLSY